MDFTILAEFRHTLYTTSFTRARDALFRLSSISAPEPRHQGICISSPHQHQA